MTDLMVREFPATGQQVRVIVRDGEPWFVAADLCAALEIANSRDAISRLDPDEKGVGTVDTLGGPQRMTIISEPGMYELISQSRKPEAKVFRRWVRHEVLPAIRKTGRYESAPTIPRTFAEALRLAADEHERAEVAARELEAAAPKVQAFDAYQSADGTHSFAEVAKMLHAVTGLGRNTLMRRLRELKVLLPSNEPYQRYAHHFHVVAQWFEHSDGTREVTNTTRVRSTGVDFIRRKLTSP